MNYEGKHTKVITHGTEAKSGECSPEEFRPTHYRLPPTDHRRGFVCVPVMIYSNNL